jgi:hypothetical protein
MSKRIQIQSDAFYDDWTLSELLGVRWATSSQPCKPVPADLSRKAS